MPLWKITDNGPSKVKETEFKQEKLLEEHLEDRIVAGAKGKIESFNSIGLHYNLVADAVYKKRSSLDSPFSPQYLQYIIAGLISFDMERMMGPDRRNRYDSSAGGFASLLGRKLAKVRSLISHLIVFNLTDLDIDKERQNITTAYKVLAEGGNYGLNQRGGEFNVGATKILHFLNPEVFLMVDSYAAKALKLPPHKISFRNATQPGYTGDKYIACMKCAQQDILDYGVDRFRALEPETPVARIYDKLTFITGSQFAEDRI